MTLKWFLLTIVLTALASLAYVRGRFLVVELSYQASAKRAIAENLEQDRRKLTLELAMLKDPQRIERIAKAKLHLTTPKGKISKILVKEGDL